MPFMILDEASSSTSYDIGTPFYVAPETKTNGYEYDEKADLYSLGDLYYFILRLITN